MNLFIDRIEHPRPHGGGFAAIEQELRQALNAGVEFDVEAGKRREFAVPAGSPAAVYVLEGSVRFEGDDTAAMAGDVVWFKPAPERALVGVQADTPTRAVLIIG